MYNALSKGVVLCTVLSSLSYARTSPLELQLEPGQGQQTSQASTKDFTKYVNVFRGVENGGNMFPGVVPAPYSVVKLGPDVVQNPPTDAYSGYLPTGNISGFSMMHESGTGGAPKYTVVSQMPVVGNVSNPLLNLSQPRAADDVGGVGWYQSQLANGVKVYLSGTEHAGLYEYTFSSKDANNVVVDVSHVLLSYRGNGWSQNYEGGSFKIFGDGHYEGYGEFNGGWNLSPTWRIYFCGMFDTPASHSRIFSGNGTTLNRYDDGKRKSTSGSDRQGGVFTFSNTNVRSRVGISWISSSKACTFANTEIPRKTTSKQLTAASRQKWNTRILSKIQTTDRNTADLTQLYSNLYGMFIIPSNRTGENPAWDTSSPNKPYYDDIFTFWDLFRCATPLTHIIDPVGYTEQINSLISVQQHVGWLPDARSSNSNGETQGGSNADNVLADAYIKGVKGVDWRAGYAAMKKDAEVTPPNNRDPRAPDSSTVQGRGALPDWLKYGYITPTFSRAVSRGIEYAANDFGLYQVARGLGLRNDANKYLKRSRNWRNYWDASATSQNYSGLLMPRATNGSFLYSDPLSSGYWMDPYYEASPWEYTFAAGHHDMAYAINLNGGKDGFNRKLEHMFTPGTQPANGQFNKTLINPGNEPSFTTPYLFNFAGRQDLSVKYARNIARTYYNEGRGGIPGNSDAGAMQSWQLWNMIGLYPLTGQTTFLISAPWFADMTIQLGSGKTLRISSEGGDRTNNVYYVQRLEINGKSWNKNWVTWDDVFARGAHMHFKLGSKPSPWDARGPPPPSPAS